MPDAPTAPSCPTCRSNAAVEVSQWPTAKTYYVGRALCTSCDRPFHFRPRLTEEEIDFDALECPECGTNAVQVLALPKLGQWDSQGEARCNFCEAIFDFHLAEIQP